MRTLVLLVEAFALAAVAVTAITIDPKTSQMMIAASQIVSRPQESAMSKMIAFAWHCGRTNGSPAVYETMASMIDGRHDRS